MFSSWPPTAALVDGVKIGCGNCSAADAASALVIFPATADQVATGDRLDRHRLELLRHHRALRVQRRIDVGRQHVGDIDPGQVVRHQVCGLVEPEIADLAQHLALARDRIGQDHVEGAEAVGRDDQELRRGACAGQFEDIAHLATVAQRQAGQIGLKQVRSQGIRHARSSWIANGRLV
jgi:hypothetical protein